MPHMSTNAHSGGLPAPIIPDVPTDEKLLVAMDFDGTLAPFSDEPLASRAEAGAIEALEKAAGLPNVEAMIISGRNLGNLVTATQLQLPCDIHLVGSHGAEPAPIGKGVVEAQLGQPHPQLSPGQLDLWQRLSEVAHDVAADAPGVWVELKPLAVGLHSRTAEDPHAAATATARYREFASSQPSAKITEGKCILEVAVDSTSKGDYVKAFCDEHGIDRILFAGDDTTDESVLKLLRPGYDIGIHVDSDGKGKPTAAEFGLGSPTAMRDYLVQLVEQLTFRA
ncbi:hypothetical protein HMPREF3098_09255 [Corynebacterium sp. HMSC28B08]|nr:hypothetical protein HMPREF3098_09255 [Corynebacterium sp. HMSC28B08]